MKITLEFDNAEKFFTELPKFASLVGFSGQFADFTHVPKPTTTPVLNDPDLPTIEKDADGGRKISGTKDQMDAVETAAAAAKASLDAENHKKAQKAEKDEVKEETDKSTPEEEKSQDEPETKAEKPITEAKVKKVLTVLSRSDHKDDVRAILGKYGASGFPEFRKMPEHFAEAYKAAKAKADEYGLEVKEDA